MDSKENMKYIHTMELSQPLYKKENPAIFSNIDKHDYHTYIQNLKMLKLTEAESTSVVTRIWEDVSQKVQKSQECQKPQC